TAKLSLQNSVISLSSLYKKTLVQSLTNTATYLYYIKQLKKRGILYIYLFSYFCYFYYIYNNNFYLS
ncbi:hypothetical protein BDDG_13041, partial [Blastomyces dermatitidis ATCC 18188]